MSQLRFYHGTHSGNLDAINAVGLIPQDNPRSVKRGNLSTINGFTEKLVFLAPCVEEAAFYAREQAEEFGFSPVIFSVLLNDDLNLTPSDDFIIASGVAAMLKAAGLPGLEFDDVGDVHEYGTSTDAYLLWSEIISLNSADLINARALRMVDLEEKMPGVDDLLDELGQLELVDTILKDVSEAMSIAASAHWQSSIASDRDPSVGYRGAIMPANLTQLDDAAVRVAMRRHCRGTGAKADWDIEVEPQSNAKKQSRNRLA